MIDFASLQAIKHELEMLQLELELHMKSCPRITDHCARDILYSRVANILAILNHAVEHRHLRRRKEDRNGNVPNTQADK